MGTGQLPKKSILSTDIIYLSLILLLSLFICWPLFNNDFMTTIDGGGHLLGLYSLKIFMGFDQLFVRWIPYLHGYGCPFFNFYPPMFATIGALLAKAGLGIVWALNLTSFFFILLSGITMYFFAKEIWGAEGGFLSAAAYIFAPYQMVDLYARGAYAESASFAFLPFILWVFLRLHHKQNILYLSIASLSVAGLILTHNCVTLMFCPVILFYIVMLNIPNLRTDYRPLLLSMTAFALGIGLACFFWLPAFVEKKYIHIEKLLNGIFDFHKNFLTIKELFYSPWPKISGTGLPFEIGPVHCLLTIISLCFIQRTTKGRKFILYLVILCVFILAITIFSTLPPSAFIWENIPILRFIQFPSRLLVLITLMVCILIGGVTLIFNSHRNQLIIMILGVLMIFMMNFSNCHPPYGTKKVNVDGIPPTFVYRNLHSQDGGEYTPIWAQDIRDPVPFKDLEIIKGDGIILSRQEVPELHQVFLIKAFSPMLVCFNVFYFPGWTIKVDGQLVDIMNDNPFGLIVFPVEEGEHVIKADFGATPIRRDATIVSIICLIFLLGLIFLGLHRLVYKR